VSDRDGGASPPDDRPTDEPRLDDPAFVDDIVAEVLREVSAPTIDDTTDTGSRARRDEEPTLVSGAPRHEGLPPDRRMEELERARAREQARVEELRVREEARLREGGEPAGPGAARGNGAVPAVDPIAPEARPSTRRRPKPAVETIGERADPAQRSRRPPPPVPASENVAARASKAVKVYGHGETEVRALDGITVDIPRRRFTAIMGPSGSGKSTLMHCMAGLDTLTSGNLYIGTTDLASLSESQLTELRRDHIGFVFQSFNLVPTLTAAENITLPADLAGRSTDQATFDQVVATVGLADRLAHRPSELSGGQQQRVAVARALVGRPDIVFADEPTGNLDTKSGNDILRFMRQAVDQLEQTIVMVTHDPAAAAHADWVLFLVDGRIVDTMRNPTARKVLDKMKELGD
jgi:putative ABC transport system ATP-binding protein